MIIWTFLGGENNEEIDENFTGTWFPYWNSRLG